MACDEVIHCIDRDLQTVMEIVRSAGVIAMEYFYGCRTVRMKNDGSSLTDADLAVEARVISGLRDAWPEDAIYSEESGDSGGLGERRWILDPIDGTHQFARGQDMWAILVALETSGTLEIGVMAFPARNETVFARRGGGCFETSASCTRRLRVSNVANVSEAYILHNGLSSAIAAGGEAGLRRVVTAARAERGYADAFGHAEVLRGRADCMIDYRPAYHDVAAASICAAEAGGRFISLNGRVQDDSAQFSLTVNAGVADEIVKLLSPQQMDVPE